MIDLVNAGADEVKRANYGNKLEQWRAMQESGCHVATSQRRDVGSTNTEVNIFSTSRRLNVATLQRCDISSRSTPHHLKYESLRNQGIGRRTNKGTEFQSRVTQTSTKCLGFVLFLIFVGYWNDVFNIKHCDFLIQDVLDLYLGFC